MKDVVAPDQGFNSTETGYVSTTISSESERQIRISLFDHIARFGASGSYANFRRFWWRRSSALRILDAAFGIDADHRETRLAQGLSYTSVPTLKWPHQAREVQIPIQKRTMGRSDVDDREVCRMICHLQFAILWTHLCFGFKLCRNLPSEDI